MRYMKRLKSTVRHRWVCIIVRYENCFCKNSDAKEFVTTFVDMKAPLTSDPDPWQRQCMGTLHSKWWQRCKIKKF